MSTRRQSRESKGTLQFGWVAVAMLALLAALLGGSSRPDAAQIVALRPLAGILLIPALYFLTLRRAATYKVPLLLLLALTGLMILQLVPLPPAVWQMLPGRDVLLPLSAAMGVEEGWRPISLVPTRTLNALASLILPVTGLVLAAAMGVRRQTLLLIIVAIGAADAALGMLQVLGPRDGPLYFYSVTNFGTPVGLFANQNHSAVFSAVVLLAIGSLLASNTGRVVDPRFRAGLGAAFLLVVIVALIGGSRAGLLTTIVALIATGAMVWLGHGASSATPASEPVRLGKFSIGPRLILAVTALLVVSIFGVFTAFEEVAALKSLTEISDFDDLRWSLLPTLREMMSVYWLPGAGFGSFEEVYHIFEPSELLRPYYINHAHNDLAQLVIEGGLAAIALTAVFLVWVGRGLLVLGRSSRAGLVQMIFWAALFAVLLFASVVDYPLRAPLFQLVAVWMVAVFARETSDYRGKSRGT